MKMIPDYPYEATHIDGLTPEIILSVIENPNATYDDLDALSFAVQNSDCPGMGITSYWIDDISNAIWELQNG